MSTNFLCIVKFVAYIWLLTYNKNKFILILNVTYMYLYFHFTAELRLSYRRFQHRLENLDKWHRFESGTSQRPILGQISKYLTP